MTRKSFLLAFVCFSFAAQVQGNELENAIKKGLTKVEAYYNRGVQRIDDADEYQSQLIQTKAASYVERIQSLRDNATQILRLASQIAEEQAKQMQTPDSALECISEAVKNANDQIQAFTTGFGADMESLEQTYLKEVQIAAAPLETYRTELNLKHETSVSQIQAGKATKLVEALVNNFYLFVEEVFDGAKTVKTQARAILGNFQREARPFFNKVNRQVSRAQSDGIRQLEECVSSEECL